MTRKKARQTARLPELQPLEPQLRTAAVDVMRGGFGLMSSEEPLARSRPLFYEVVYFDQGDATLRTQKIYYAGSVVVRAESAQKEIEKVDRRVQSALRQSSAVSGITGAAYMPGKTLTSQLGDVAEIVMTDDANPSCTLGGVLVVSSSNPVRDSVRLAYNKALMDADATWAIRDLVHSGRLSLGNTELATAVLTRKDTATRNLSAVLVGQATAEAEARLPALVYMPELEYVDV